LSLAVALTLLLAASDGGTALQRSPGKPGKAPAAADCGGKPCSAKPSFLKGGTPRTQEEIEEQMQDEAIALAYASMDAGPPRPPFEWRLKNVVGSIEMPGIQEANGVPVKLHSLTVRSNLQDILDDLINQFTSQGLYMRPFLDQEQPMAQTQVTAFDPVRQISYTAIIECVKGPCTVMLGEANIRMGVANANGRGGQQDFVPLPSDAISVQRSRAENYETLAFSFPGAPDGVRSFYANTLTRQGYSKKGKDLWSRPGDTIQLVFKNVDGRNLVMLSHSKGSLEGDDTPK
jgi:hypothetical protein